MRNDSDLDRVIEAGVRKHIKELKNYMNNLEYILNGIVVRVEDLEEENV